MLSVLTAHNIITAWPYWYYHAGIHILLAHQQDVHAVIYTSSLTFENIFVFHILLTMIMVHFFWNWVYLRIGPLSFVLRFGFLCTVIEGSCYPLWSEWSSVFHRFTPHLMQTQYLDMITGLTPYKSWVLPSNIDHWILILNRAKSYGITYRWRLKLLIHPSISLINRWKFFTHSWRRI